MILFWCSLLSGICFVITAANADSDKENNGLSPKNLHFSPGFHKRPPTRLTMALNKQLLKYVSSNISGYTELADFLSGPSANLDLILNNLGNDLTLTRELFIRPDDVAESISHCDDVKESDFKNIADEIKLRTPASLFLSGYLYRNGFSTNDRLVFINQVTLSPKIIGQPLRTDNEEQIIYTYKSEWIHNFVDGLDAYRLSVPDSSSVDVYFIESNNFESVLKRDERETLLKFDYSTLAGVPNTTIAVEGFRFQDAFSTALDSSPASNAPEDSESKRIHFIEKTTINFKNIMANEYIVGDVSRFYSGSDRSEGTGYTPTTIEEGSIHFLLEIFIAVVHKSQNTQLGLVYNGVDWWTIDQFSFTSLRRTMKTLYTTPISDMLPSFTGNSFVMSPLAYYHQIIYKYKYVQRAYHFEIVRNFLKLIVNATTFSKKIQLKNFVYVDTDKNFDIKRGIQVDILNKSIVKELNQTIPDLFPLETNLFDANFVMNSKVDINLQLNNQKYQFQKIIDGGSEIPLMFVKSDTFYHCSANETGNGMSIYKLPLADQLPVHLYIIEVQKDSDVRYIFNIDYTKLITRKPIGTKDIWIPEVHSERKLHKNLKLVAGFEPFQYKRMKVHHLQNTSIALTAKNMSRQINSTNQKTDAISIVNFIYAIVDNSSGIVIATGFHRVTLSDIVRPFAVDFDTKAIISFDNAGKDYATSILGHFLNNLLLKHVKSDHAVKLKVLLHGKDLKFFNAMHRGELERIESLINFSIKNKLFIGESDVSKENHETNEVKLVDFANPKTVVESINEFSAGIIKEKELTSSDRLAMVSDVQIKLTLMMSENYRWIPSMHQQMMPVVAKRHSSSMSDCLIGAKYYQLPLDKTVRREIDVFVIVPDDDDRLDTSCIHKIDFRGFKFETYEDIFVPLVNIVKKFHKNLKEISDKSSDDERIHVLQKVFVQWDGRKTAIDPGLIRPANVVVMRKFLWVVVTKSQLILAHGFVIPNNL